MNPEEFAFAVGVAVLIGGSLGLVLHRVLPEKHVTGGGKDMVGAVVGLFTLLFALHPSQIPVASPAGSSRGATRPISSANSRRAAASGVSPRLTPPPGKFHSFRYEERTSRRA